MNLEKFAGVFPAFYACYDRNGQINPQAVRDFTNYLIEKKVNGVYVGGSSGECIYQSVAERKLVLENVMSEAKGKLVVIAHVACNNTQDSCELARHAESLSVDAIASIPPIYFHLPEFAIARYWNDISAAAPKTPFIIYNIPQLAGVELTIPLLREMKKNPLVIGVKNSSMPIFDIQRFHSEDIMVFNGPDEQFVSGLLIGAIGGIGGTYAAMPELFIKVYKLLQKGEIKTAQTIQDDICKIIAKMCSTKGNMYATIKAIIRLQGGPDLGGVRQPLANLFPEDEAIVKECHELITNTIAKYAHI